MTDLLKAVKQETEIDLSLLKINITAFTGVVFALGFSYFLNQLFQNFSGLTINLTLTFIFGTLFLVVVFLQSILIKDLKRIAMILFLQTAALLVPFIFLLSSFILVGFIIAYGLLLWGSSSCKNELRYSMKIRIFRISKFVLPKAITGISIFIVASYMSVFKSTGFLMSFDTFRRVVLPVESLAKIILTGFSIEDSFSDIVLKSNEKLQEVPSAEQKTIIEEQRKYFADVLNYDFKITDSAIMILYNAYVHNVGQISQNSKVIILVVLGFILFILVRSIGTPISWFVALIAAIIYEILITLGFAVVVLESRSREIILLK